MISNTEASLAPFLFVSLTVRERERVAEVLGRGGAWKRMCFGPF